MGFRLRGERDFINQPYDKYDHENSTLKLYNYVVYQGGANFLYELKETMGDAKFYYMMQQYYQTYCLKDVSGRAFVEAVRTYDDSKEVNDVIKKYLDESLIK